MGYEIKRNSSSNEFNLVNVHKRAGSTAQMQLHCQQIITITIIIIIIIDDDDDNNNNNNNNNNSSSTEQYST
jgi:hypothetical protein